MYKNTSQLGQEVGGAPGTPTATYQKTQVDTRTLTLYNLISCGCVILKARKAGVSLMIESSLSAHLQEQIAKELINKMLSCCVDTTTMYCLFQ